MRFYFNLFNKNTPKLTVIAILITPTNRKETSEKPFIFKEVAKITPAKTNLPTSIKNFPNSFLASLFNTNQR